VYLGTRVEAVTVEWVIGMTVRMERMVGTLKKT
jgi:hypothetical protein